MDPISFLFDKIGSLAVDDFEIYQCSTNLFSVQARDERVEFAEQAIEQGIAIRLFKGARCSFGCTSDGTPPFLERMLDCAYNSLSVLGEGGMFEFPAGRDGRIENSNPRKGGKVSSSEKIELAMMLEKGAKEFDKRIVRIRDARYSEEARRVRLKNSRGLDLECSSSLFELSLMVMSEEGKNQEMAWDEEFSTEFSKLQPRKLARGVAEKAVSQLGAKPIKTQKTAALLDPVVAASFLGILSQSFFGDQVQKGRSALCGKVDEEIYSKVVTVMDDGKYEGGYSTFPFDGEGTLTRRNVLVSDGFLKQFLYDSRSAAQEKKESTGNGIRPHFKEPPRVGASNFFIEPGQGNLDQLLAEMGSGFWVRDVIGMHTADPVTGDFSLGASGVWIEGGKRTHPVRGVTVSGNLHEVLKNVVQVGEGVRFYRSYGSPPLLIRLIDVGGL